MGITVIFTVAATAVVTVQLNLIYIATNDGASGPYNNIEKTEKTQLSDELL